MDDINELDFKKVIIANAQLIFRVGLSLVILSAFFLFTSLTTDIFDTPKFLVLLAFTALMLVLVMLKFTTAGKVVITRTPLDIPLLLLLAVASVSTYHSSSPYVSLLGNNLKVSNSLVGLVALVLFYFVLTNSLKGIKEIKWLFGLAIIASQILSIVSLLAYAGIKILPAPWVQTANFTTTGSAFSTTAILALLLPFIVMQILTSRKPISLILGAIFLILSGATIALTGTLATWVAAILGLVLTVAIVIGPVKKLSQISPISLICLIGPIVIIVLITALSFIPPMKNVKNPLYTLTQSFPREAQLELISSWKISVSTFRDLPFWGSGPATYLFDFTNYKPIEFNSGKVWNIRFDSSFNEYLQVLATLGIVGLVALLSLTALFISAAYKVVSTVYRLPSTAEVFPSGGPRKSEDSLKLATAIAGLIFFILLALHAATLPIWIVGILILAGFMVVNLSGSLQRSNHLQGDFKSVFLKIAGNITTASSEETIKVNALPAILLVISLIVALFAFYFGGKLTLADYHHRLAINAVSQNNGIAAYNELVAAEKLNPVSDVYRTDLAQTNFALANAIATAKGPTEASPAGSLTDQDKQNIQVLLQQSINEGRTAVTLSPKSSQNWEILAALYRQISGVAQNALAFALDSYGRAILQDPLNPSLRLSAGGVYYATKNYDMAIRFFTDAVNLKPDFPNAYYNLSVALRDKGDLVSAQAMAEKALTLVDKSSPDYKILNDYLTDLKSKNTTVQEPPAAQTQGALQDKTLPKVLSLPKPENIATPAAVKKPQASPTPSTNP